MAEKDFSTIDNDRFLRRDANQSDQTKDAVYVASNPAPKRGDDSLRKQGRPKGSEEDGGAPNVLTGTVITSCFIQTSALPSRVEMQGNDITFFDDTYSRGGKLIGDTSRLIFTHASGKEGEEIVSGFIFQKRALIGNTYDNVLELFSPNNDPDTNYVFIGRMGTGEERNIAFIEVAPDYRTNVGDSKGYLNGVFRARVSRDGINGDYRDGLYVMDRGTESSSLEGCVGWIVGGGPNGQARLSYMPNRDGNPLDDSIYDIYVSSLGINFFVNGVIVMTIDGSGVSVPGGLTLPGDLTVGGDLSVGDDLTVTGDATFNGEVTMNGIPTSSPGGSRRVWKNGTVLNIT